MKKTMTVLAAAVLAVTGCARTATKCEAFKEVFKQNQAYFATNKADLTPETKQVLDKQAQWLKSNPEKKIIVKGYADPRGAAEHNMRLGQKRAQAVKDYLVQSGVDANRVSVVSFGETDLASTKNTHDGWIEDRRTVSVIVTE